MRTSNTIFAVLFSIIAIFASIAALCGATHQAFLAAISGFVAIALIMDNLPRGNKVTPKFYTQP